MARTTLALDLIELIQLGKAAKEDILRHLAAASDGAERLRQGSPAITVRFEQLRLPPSAGSPGLARGTAFGRVVDPIYELWTEVELYDLTDKARVDVIRLGRHPSQDVQLLDPLVSREHGLVIFGRPVPLFCDYGTLIDGKHAGSRNGTHLNGVRRISDTVFPWLPGQVLMLGEEFEDRQGEPCFTFKLTYKLHATDDTFGN